MSYFRKGLSGLAGVQSQPPGKRVSRGALGGIQSRPAGGRVSRSALGAATPEFTLLGSTTPAPLPPLPPPSRVMSARGRTGPHWYRQLAGTTLGGTTLGADPAPGDTLSVPTLSEPGGAIDTRDPITRIDQNVARLVEAEADEAKRRKLALILTGIGVVFTAAKLGIIAIPYIRKSRET